jgi:LPS export ABC transporter protein LptC
MKLTKFRLSLILTGIILITVGAVALRFFEDRQQREPVTSETDTPDGASMALANVRQTSVKDGIKEWHLDAVAATLLEAEHKMILEQPTVEFFMQNGETMTLTAQKGVLDTESNDIEVSGNVIVRHQTYTLMGEAFAYTHANQRLFSQAPVEISSERMNLTAERMTVDLKTQETELAGNVKGRINESLSL